MQPAKSGACEAAPWHNQIRNGRDARVLGQVLHFGSSTLGGLTLEFRQIRYALSVAKERSFTKAAKRLNISQSAVSEQINRHRLEQGFATPWDDSPEYFSYRMGRLKRDIERALYVDTRALARGARAGGGTQQ